MEFVKIMYALPLGILLLGAMYDLVIFLFTEKNKKKIYLYRLRKIGKYFNIVSGCATLLAMLTMLYTQTIPMPVPWQFWLAFALPFATFSGSVFITRMVAAVVGRLLEMVGKCLLAIVQCVARTLLDLWKILGKAVTALEED
jgi:hypothetical protein